MNPCKFGTTTFSIATIGAAMSLFAGTCTAQSSEPEGRSIRISGFETLGVVQAQAPDSRLGIQLKYAAGTRLELVGQLLATWRASDLVIREDAIARLMASEALSAAG